MPKKKPTKTPRAKIDAAMLIHELEQYVLDRREMTPAQVSAALALLKKIMPDMAAPVRRIVAEAEAIHAQRAGHEDALKDLE